MKLFCLILLALLSGCSVEKEVSALDVTEVWSETVCPEDTEPETVIPETIAPEELSACLSPLVNPKDTDFVRVNDYIPDVLTELKYATQDNFTGQVIYEFEDVFLRYGTVTKLKAVSEELAEQGIGIKIWDGFRPVSAQFKLWEICPDDTFVANPNVGYSNHSRGFAVDLTLVDKDGNELQMPSGFDDFSAVADRDYSDCDPQAAQNAQLLESVMEKHGFQGYWGEWWHFNDSQKYDVEEHFDPSVIGLCSVSEGTVLLEAFWNPSTVILTVPAGDKVTRLGFQEEYTMVEYWGYRGYISTALLQDE